MLLGVRSKKIIFKRHTTAGLLAALIIYIFWLSRPEWSADMRLWRAVGDSSFMLLFLTLIIGPLSRLWKPGLRMLTWRRELGIWFAIIALIHTLLILNGWMMWNVQRFFGYEFIPEAERFVRLESGFGLANSMGLLALFLSLILAVTSSDRAVSYLGISSWKWLHNLAYTIFYLIGIHILYFMFIHFTVSFHRPVPPPNWFRFPSLILIISVLLLQLAAFIKTVTGQKRKNL